MHQAARLEFERVMEEFVRWHVVPENERSPAPAWWWGPAMAVVDDQEPMSATSCCALNVSEGTSFAEGARAILALFTEQTSLTGPQDFPSKAEGEEHEVRELHPQPSDDSAFQP
ncbi:MULTISPECIES: hypothetical protein [Bradyrhizobium]|uniref:hypothetical protein n=1 Tax=Bradyrhizobium TaxID=374 RepID=UPI0004BC399F|nr:MULTISPECIES: hypothetical protein [unclassified Bradyrhizobium]MCA1380396.1 hypothetical protein [Bradyrhizobium sp. BRP05]MCA1390150.1 hypothetical protein [Bradyrhizobium sp. IC3123]MCA1374972.1 hypothetical protein [Bradyrhizobium sp. IC4060]MCA1419841.1 hypothetical protein [Bradyrhizobium sp. BRP23]MCA1425246.1 hypothetical protein [Bradyrhizobium sp. NBAIM16]